MMSSTHSKAPTVGRNVKKIMFAVHTKKLKNTITLTPISFSKKSRNAATAKQEK